jgi:uncharacterized membrane protein YgdD (TMEM256/DUF423 family)
MIGNTSRVVLALTALAGTFSLFVPSWVSYTKDYEILKEGVIVQCRTIASDTRCELVSDWTMYAASALIVVGISVVASLTVNPTLDSKFLAVGALLFASALAICAFFLIKPVESFDGRLDYGFYVYAASVAAVLVVLVLNYAQVSPT